MERLETTLCLLKKEDKILLAMKKKRVWRRKV